MPYGFAFVNGTSERLTLGVTKTVPVKFLMLENIERFEALRQCIRPRSICSAVAGKLHHIFI